MYETLEKSNYDLYALVDKEEMEDVKRIYYEKGRRK